MDQQIDLQDAFDALTKDHLELTFAFYGFAALVSGYMTGGQTYDAKTLADEFDHLARDAGERMNSMGSERPQANQHLKFLATTMRNLGKPVGQSLVPSGEPEVITD